MLYYLTRDSYSDGSLLPGVHVWNHRPDRIKDPDGILGYIWKQGKAGWIATLTIEQAAKQFRTLPETDLECIRIMIPELSPGT